MPRRRVNLVPPEVAVRRKQRRLVTNAIGAGAILLALLALLYGIETVRVSGAHRDLARQEQSNQRLQGQLSQLAEFDQLQQRVQDKTNLLKTLTGNEVRWSVLLADISLVIPSDAWLTSLTGSLNATPALGAVGALQMSGVTFSHLDVAKWLTQLAGVMQFVDPYLSLSSKSTIGTTPVVNFSSTVNLSLQSLRSNQPGGERAP